jgi:hypothetical protein
VVPGTLAVVTWVDAGAGEDGREGRLRIGRVRSVFIVTCGWDGEYWRMLN